MKRVLVGLALIMSFSLIGCNSVKKTAVPAGNQQNTASNNTSSDNTPGQFAQNPEFKLARAIMGISRVQMSQTPLTKEQAQKLIVLVKDIKSKETIDQAYADKKTDEINQVFTDQQKQLMSQRNGRNNRWQGQENGNNPPGQMPDGTHRRPGNNIQQGKGNIANPQGRVPGNMPYGQGNGRQRGSGPRGMDLKSVCDRAITELQK